MENQQQEPAIDVENQPAMENVENADANGGPNAENPQSPPVVLQNGVPMVQRRRRRQRQPLGEIGGPAPRRRALADITEEVPGARRRRRGEDEGFYYEKRVRVVLPDGRSFNIRFRVHRVDE